MAFFRFIYKSLILLRALIRHRYLFSENQSQKTKELCGLLHDLGPFYVKLGQILSTRPDLIGEDLAHILSDLQDRLPAFSGEVARAIIERELKQPLADIFPVFQKEAIAAASVAQVHLAEDAAGHKFAIKVLRPEIEKRFAEDVRFLRILSKIGLFIKPGFKRFKPLETLDLVQDMIRVETNLLMEASALSEFGENFKDGSLYKIPAVHWDLTSQRVLTINYVEGISIDEVDELRARGIDTADVLKRLSVGFFRQIFEFGFFHADLHPGNILIGSKGEIYLIDFGIMGRIDSKTLAFLADVLIGFLTRDYAKVAKAHFKSQIVSPLYSEDLFMQAIRSIGETVHQRSLKEISIAKLLAQLFQITKEFQMEVQPELLLLQKTLLILEATSRKLDPKANIWADASGEIKKSLMQHSKLKNRAKRHLQEIGDFITVLPQLADKVTTTLQRFEDENQMLIHQKKSRPFLKYAGLSAFSLASGYFLALYFST
jgi:ubiquinone biosynthesis protein